MFVDEDQAAADDEISGSSLGHERKNARSEKARLVMVDRSIPHVDVFTRGLSSPRILARSTESTRPIDFQTRRASERDAGAKGGESRRKADDRGG